MTGEAQRAQAGPEPGAERRRPQWGQNGIRPSNGWLQNGHTAGVSARAVAAALGGSRTRVPGMPPPPPCASLAGAAAGVAAGVAAAVAFMAAALPSGLPQSMQNWAP